MFFLHVFCFCFVLVFQFLKTWCCFVFVSFCIVFVFLLVSLCFLYLFLFIFILQDGVSDRGTVHPFLALPVHLQYLYKHRFYFCGSFFVLDMTSVLALLYQKLAVSHKHTRINIVLEMTSVLV